MSSFLLSRVVAQFQVPQKSTKNGNSSLFMEWRLYFGSIENAAEMSTAPPKARRGRSRGDLLHLFPMAVSIKESAITVKSIPLGVVNLKGAKNLKGNRAM